MKLTIRKKLLLLNAVVVAAATSLIVLGAYLLASYQMRQETRGFLSDEFGEYSNKYAAMLDNPETLRREMAEHFTAIRMTYPIICRIYTEDGTTAAKVENVSSAPDTTDSIILNALAGQEIQHTLYSHQDNRKFWCMIKPVRSPSGQTFAFELGLDVRHLNKRMRRLRNYLLLAMPVVLVVSLASAWWMVRKSLQPVEDLLQRLHAIRSASLNRRLPVRNSGDEFDSLALAANEMLDEIEGSFTLTKEFTADAAHELRTPLTRLTVMLEDSLNRSLSVEDAREVLDEAYENCARLRHLIDDLMLLAQLDSGEIEGTTTSFTLSQTIRDLQEIWAAACDERNVQLKITCQEDPVVRGRPVLLRRVLANLVDNALCHTPDGGVIRIYVERRRQDVVVRVSDSGPGISKEALPKVFNRFYRADAARVSTTGGTGLGLSICRKIVELHGGHIDVENIEGKGTTFVVVLPASEGGSVDKNENMVS